jgi:hypothetical protein
MGIQEQLNEILRALGRIEGRMAGLNELPERVSHIEMCLSWLKGGLAAIAAGFAYLCRTVR